MTTMQQKPQQAPQDGQEAPKGMAPAPVDPTDEGRRLLASLEAEIRDGEATLTRTLHEGAEHFRAGMEKATKGLQDAHLDGWTHQAAALARVGSAAGSTRMPPQDAPQKKS